MTRWAHLGEIPHSSNLAGMAILGFHLGIYAVMDILFLFGIMELVLLVFPWARWIDAVPE